MPRPLGRRLLVVGTAQLGLPHYGIANTSGRPPEEEAVEFLREAFDAGVGGVDCAPAYGLAEQIVGRALPGAPADLAVVTKLFPREPAPPTAVAVRRSVENSLRLLGLARLPIYLLHDWEHRHMNDSIVWRTLLELRDEGKIERLGVSAHYPPEAGQAAADPDVSHIQLPCNLLDDRWEAAIPAFQARTDLTIHVRSTFLQGVFFLPPDCWPQTTKPHASALFEVMTRLSNAHGRRDLRDFALAWARSQPWVHGVVLGMETSAQLRANLELFDTPLLPPDTLTEIRRELAGAPRQLLDPSTWQA